MNLFILNTTNKDNKHRIKNIIQYIVIQESELINSKSDKHLQDFYAENCKTYERNQ